MLRIVFRAKDENTASGVINLRLRRMDHSTNRGMLAHVTSLICAVICRQSPPPPDGTMDGTLPANVHRLFRCQPRAPT